MGYLIWKFAVAIALLVIAVNTAKQGIDTMWEQPKLPPHNVKQSDKDR